MLRRIVLIFVISLLLVLEPLTLCAQRSLGKNSLRGLKGVFVLVETITGDAQRQGLTEGQLQTDAELRLRKANIRVASQAEATQSGNSDNIGILVINVGTMQVRDSLYVTYISVDLRQSVRLVRDNSIIVETAATYQTAALFGTVSSNNLRETVRNEVNDKIDRFMNDYLAVNQK